MKQSHQNKFSLIRTRTALSLVSKDHSSSVNSVHSIEMYLSPNEFTDNDDLLGILDEENEPEIFLLPDFQNERHSTDPLATNRVFYPDRED